MDELTSSIKMLNVAFTNTFYDNGLNRKRIKLDEIKVNFENSISLYDILDKFNRLYVSFKKEYKNLSKLDLGKNIEIECFTGFKENNYRELSICIDEPVFINKDYTVLYLTEKNGILESYITNDINPLDKNYYFKEIKLDNEKVKSYLDLFEKYSILFYLYYHFKNTMIFSDGSNTLFIEICGRHCNLLDTLEKFKISIFMCRYDEIIIMTNLGDKFGINVDESKLEIKDKVINANEEDFLNVLKNIYINEKYLNTYWDRVDHKEKVSARLLIKKADNIYNFL